MSPTPRSRAELGARLRLLRERAGLGQSDVAARTGWQQPRVSKIERGRQMPSDADLALWLDLVTAGNDDRAQVYRLRDVARLAERSFGDLWRSDDIVTDQAFIAEFERQAEVICEYQPGLVPALVQTPEYARAVITVPGGPAALRGASPDRVDGFVTERMARQALLYAEGKRIRLLLGEAALHTRFGSPEVASAMLAGQLDRLLMVARLPTVELAVLPFDRPCPMLPIAGLSLVDRTAWVETLVNERELDDDVATALCLEAFEVGMAAAVRGQEAVELIRAIAAALR